MGIMMNTSSSTKTTTKTKTKINAKKRKMDVSKKNNNHRDDDEETVTLLLKNAIDYVISFNMKGLQRIEKKLFFPFVKEKIRQNISNNNNNNQIVRAYDVIFNHIEYNKKNILLKKNKAIPVGEKTKPLPKSTII